MWGVGTTQHSAAPSPVGKDQSCRSEHTQRGFGLVHGRSSLLDQELGGLGGGVCRTVEAGQSYSRSEVSKVLKPGPPGSTFSNIPSPHKTQTL